MHFSFFSCAVETQAKTTSVQERVDQNREAFEVTGYQFSDADGGVHFGSITDTRAEVGLLLSGSPWC